MVLKVTVVHKSMYLSHALLEAVSRSRWICFLSSYMLY